VTEALLSIVLRHIHTFSPLILTPALALVIGSSVRSSAAIDDGSNLPENLGPNVNGPYDDVLPVISTDGRIMYFCRSHDPANIGGGKQDIYVSERDSVGNWQPAYNIGPPLNNDRNNALCSITADGMMAFVINDYGDKDLSTNGFAVTQLSSLGWSLPKQVIIEDYYNKHRFAEMTCAYDASALIMSLQREDAVGNRDLYVSFPMNNGSWTRPMNLGDIVNTNKNEATPFLAADNETLYFASEGHDGYGRFDVFVTRRLDSTWRSWSVPENLGPTINSEGWDLYLTVPASGDYAYFTSYVNTYGAGDIFRVKLPKEAKPKPVVLLFARVWNAETKAPIEGEIVWERSDGVGPQGSVRTRPKSNRAIVLLDVGRDYTIRARRGDQLGEPVDVSLDGIDSYLEMEYDFFVSGVDTKAGKDE
jgi:OmpA-OmpF porin, OOP family